MEILPPPTGSFPRRVGRREDYEVLEKRSHPPQAPACLLPKPRPRVPPTLQRDGSENARVVCAG